MNAPMMLPWLARKWEVSDVRAVELWQQACKDAEKKVGREQSPEYWACAKRRLIDLLDMEVISHVPATETPWVMINLNVLRLIVGLKFLFSGKELAYSRP